MTALRIGTRGSELALFQANAVAALLHAQAGLTAEIVIIKTSGDRLAEATLSEIGGKRLFVKEIEDALLDGRVDLAVHSSKDMPVVLPPRLQISAVLPREDARDAVVLPSASGDRADDSLAALTRVLGREPRIGTSSVRRVAQLRRLWPGAHFLPIRGNLGTRLRKLDTGEYDALVLAAAGLLRLGRGERITASLPIEACVPAPGQGIIAIETRSDDQAAIDAALRISDAGAAAALTAERAVIARLGGGCQMPIGAYAGMHGDQMHMTAVVVSLDGARAAHASGQGTLSDPDGLGALVADRLRSEGADDILADVTRAHAAVEGLQP
jgi:hydroxymethylbilane synthase